MKKSLISILCIIAITTFSLEVSAARIKINNANREPMPIAITEFLGQGDMKNIGKNMSDVIQNNLDSSGLFKSINRKSFVGQIKNITLPPRFADWRVINAQILLIGSLKKTSGGKFITEFRLWDVYSGREYVSKKYPAPVRSWRRVAHKISDDIYTRLTGEGGYFDSSIVYVAQDGNWKKPRKRLAIMDQDGANHTFLTDGRDMVLSPRFDPTSQRIIYMSYRNNKPAVYLYDLPTGRISKLGNFKGMSYAPRFSNDGKKAVLSVSNRGVSNIYVMDIASKRTKRITKSNSIDTSPSFSADDSKIVFNSDRSGRQHIYVMDADGDNIHRISNGKGSYATPVWSPRGDLIAFTKMYRGKFYIGVMRPNGKGERLITESYLDEGPTWSPNGRVILFNRQARGTKTASGVKKLYSIDLTGYNEKMVKTPTQAIDPAWSPLK